VETILLKYLYIKIIMAMIEDACMLI